MANVLEWWANCWKKSLIMNNQRKNIKMQEAWWLTYNVVIANVFISVKMTTYSKANERNSAVKKLQCGTGAEWHHANSASNFDIPHMSKFHAKMTTMITIPVNSVKQLTMTSNNLLKQYRYTVIYLTGSLFSVECRYIVSI